MGFQGLIEVDELFKADCFHLSSISKPSWKKSGKRMNEDEKGKSGMLPVLQIKIIQCVTGFERRMGMSSENAESYLHITMQHVFLCCALRWACIISKSSVKSTHDRVGC